MLVNQPHTNAFCIEAIKDFDLPDIHFVLQQHLGKNSALTVTVQLVYVCMV